MQIEGRRAPAKFHFGLSTSSFEGTHVVAVRGELDLHTVPELNETLTQLAGLASHQVIVDLSHATLVDSASLSALLETVRGLRANGREIVVSCKDRSIRKVFAITGADRLVPIHASLEEAVQQALERTFGLAHRRTPLVALTADADRT